MTERRKKEKKVLCSHISCRLKKNGAFPPRHGEIIFLLSSAAVVGTTGSPASDPVGAEASALDRPGGPGAWTT